MTDDNAPVRDSPPAPSDAPQPSLPTQRQNPAQVAQSRQQTAAQPHEAPTSALDRTTARSAQSTPPIIAPFAQATRLNPQNTGQVIYPAHGPVYTGWQGPPMAGNYRYPAYNALPSMQWQQGPLPYMPQMYGTPHLAPQHAQHPAYTNTSFGQFQEAGFPRQYLPVVQQGDASDRRLSTGGPPMSSPQSQQHPAMLAAQSRQSDLRMTPTHQLSHAGRARTDEHRIVDDSRAVLRRSSATGTRSTPSYPRGPPRKPKQSGFALWVGNLPPRTDIIELKDHFSRDATQDIESVFLISKSNCAFVNYRTDEACKAAMTRFDAVRFRGAQLVCRTRNAQQGASEDPKSEAVPSSAREGEGRSVAPDSIPAPAAPEVPSLGQKTAASTIAVTEQASAQPKEGIESAIPTERPTHGSASPLEARYFIVKSLTLQDLDASVRDGIWATQSHNEKALDDAYQGGQTVYLIFSANKSGEYYGYARMASAVDTQSVTVNPRLRLGVDEIAAEEPISKATPATAHAPKGRVVDDSARGTIFWEAEHATVGPGSGSLDEASQAHAATDDPSKGAKEQDWGKPFKVEWLSTTPLPFYRTKGLRNPWNSNREVKIARDGTELEPSVGRTLLGMFDTPAEPGSAGNTETSTR